jgi:hypothetical protein
VPTVLLSIAALRADSEHVDKATALRQLLYAGAEDYLTQLVCAGKLSIGRAAELLDVPMQDLQLRVAACAGPTAEQLQSSARTLATLKGK